MVSGEIETDTDAQLETWANFVNHVNELIDSRNLNEWYIRHNLGLGQMFAEAREVVLSDSEDWAIQFKENVLVPRHLHPMNWDYRIHKDLEEWTVQSTETASKALKAIWTKTDSPVAERIRAFSGLLPDSIVHGLGSRMRVVSALLMGLDATSYPPVANETFKKAYRKTGYDQPRSGADEAALYEHALGFLDQFLEEAQARGAHLQHRLDMQSVIWHFRGEKLGDLPILDIGPSYPQGTLRVEVTKVAALSPPCDFQGLARRIHLTADFIEEINALLIDKRQVIFQGPPGTGKTYVAQELAECLAGGNENRVTLVQFHPSYAYEDFVRGFRPSIEGGQAGFELQDGPLLQAAEKARADREVDPEAKHYLIIDEINRGNIAKVFGELYFLLEYRDKKINLQYQREPGETFSLPENLYIIGTMNTADRSIALVDLALRRRFYFIEFHPDDEPVKSVLRKWLGEGSELEWVADVVEEANRQLEEYKHAAIGPSYFMKDGLREEDVPRVWKHSVLPYIEELLFGDDTKIQQLQLKELCETVAPHINWSDGDEKKDDNAISNSEVVNDATDQPSGVPGEQSSPS